MRTTVLGIRLNDYQRDRLRKIAFDNDQIEADIVRCLVDKLIEGKINLGAPIVEEVDLSGLRKVARDKGLSLQRLIDLVVEQLDE